jgi:mannose-6-phosphate isomerase
MVLMRVIEPVIQHYAWGSTDAIAHVLQRDPDGRPWAEAWMGAHPIAPSPITGTDDTLADVIARSPERELGPHVWPRFGGLPFLFKVLSASLPLSIQTHPSIAQAEAGFQRENALGIALTDPVRSYKDANHKPELLCALTEFEALCGFESVDVIADRFEQVGGALAPWSDRARVDGIASLVANVLSLTSPQQHQLVDAIARGGLRLAWIDRCVTDFPGDVGSVIALMLRHLVLQPGEAIYLDAGNVHAYLRGTGLELMANSDNVLRAGLTPKHLDVNELLEVMVVDGAESAVVRRSPDGRYLTDCPDFELSVVEPGQTRTVGGPTIVLSLDGPATLTSKSATLELANGGCAFIANHDGPVRVTPTGHAWLASTGRDHRDETRR